MTSINPSSAVPQAKVIQKLPAKPKDVEVEKKQSAKPRQDSVEISAAAQAALKRASEAQQSGDQDHDGDAK